MPVTVLPPLPAGLPPANSPQGRQRRKRTGKRVRPGGGIDGAPMAGSVDPGWATGATRRARDGVAPDRGVRSGPETTPPSVFGRRAMHGTAHATATTGWPRSPAFQARRRQSGRNNGIAPCAPPAAEAKEQARSTHAGIIPCLWLVKIEKIAGHYRKHASFRSSCLRLVDVSSAAGVRAPACIQARRTEIRRPSHRRKGSRTSETQVNALPKRSTPRASP